MTPTFIIIEKHHCLLRMVLPGSDNTENSDMAPFNNVGSMVCVQLELILP